MAPEVVKQTAHTAKADIWSVGCLVVEMFTGEHPWAQLNQMQAIFKIGAGNAPPPIPGAPWRPLPSMCCCAPCWREEGGWRESTMERR